MTETSKPEHSYHLVEPSPWPILASIFSFIIALGAILLFRQGHFWLMCLGLLGIIYCAVSWWADVIKEAHQGDHTSVVQLHLRYGMILFIFSEVMFFVVWFWAYFNVSLYPADWVQYMRADLLGGVWPPKDIATFDPWHLPFINTLILLSSGTTVTWAHHALLHNDRTGLVRGLALTILLGILFTCVQAYEYMHADFAFEGHIYGTTFFMATGFHGFHVIIGTIFLSVCLVRALLGHFTHEQHFGFEAAAWYWHFVDVIWLFLFVVIYVAGAGQAH